jgi:hypothetical protein
MKKILSIITMACLVLGCSQPRLATYQKEEIECLGIEGDGSQTLRVTGTGRTKADALEQAKKDAVFAVIFNGIRGGIHGCDARPLINEQNARDKYAEYFDIFFMDKGEYSKYVSLEDRKLRSNEVSKNQMFENYRLTIRVLRSELRARLRADGLINR